MPRFVVDGDQNYSVALEANERATRLMAKDGFLPLLTIYVNVRGEETMSVSMPEVFTEQLKNPDFVEQLTYSFIEFLNNSLKPKDQQVGGRVNLRSDEAAQEGIQQAKAKPAGASIPLGPGRADN